MICLTPPELAALTGRSLTLIACTILAACTTPHDPAREGVWIVKPAPLVRCEQTPEGVVCGSVRAVQVEEVGI